VDAERLPPGARGAHPARRVVGDRFGRRRVFVIGVVWFTIASALCALAPTVETLVAGRVLQGIGGALLMPGSLAMIEATFVPADRAKAIGAWSALGGIAVAIGPWSAGGSSRRSTGGGSS
jgi:MFS family permease